MQKKNGPHPIMYMYAYNFFTIYCHKVGRPLCGYLNMVLNNIWLQCLLTLLLLNCFQELKGRHGAPGDFAQAYVLAHEVGHHVQNVIGVTPRIMLSVCG